jgi:SEC-C motif-containing protein
MTDTNFCPCGSEIDLSSCCLPHIEGKTKPSTAEALLRARYTAFSRGDIDYILSTHHSRTHDSIKREEIEDWSKNSDWLGLKVVQTEKGQGSDQEGSIVFCAKYKTKTPEVQVHEHWEKSFFEKEKGEWAFLDAQGVQMGTYRRETSKVGRNEPCPCGSGKKYKKCCEGKSAKQ